MVLYAFLRLTSSMLDRVKKDGAHSSKERDDEPAKRLRAEVIDWFLAIDVMQV
jgi:hypothetical protein